MVGRKGFQAGPHPWDQKCFTVETNMSMNSKRIPRLERLASRSRRRPSWLRCRMVFRTMQSSHAEFTHAQHLLISQVDLWQGTECRHSCSRISPGHKSARKGLTPDENHHEKRHDSHDRQAKSWRTSFSEVPNALLKAPNQALQTLQD